MGVKNYLKRGLEYVISGKPQYNITAEIKTIGYNELLKGRVALITGGGSGIGKAIAKAFSRSGATVVVAGRNIDRLNECCDEIRNDVGCDIPIFPLQLDLNRVDEFEEKIFESLTRAKVANFDLLVNNGGILGNTSLDCSAEDFDKVISTNLRGTFFLSRIVAMKMVDGGVKGNIINIASSSSLRPAANPYTISKWGIRGLTLGMAKKLIPYGIVVNGIAPGPVATPMMGKDSLSNIGLPKNPSGRFALAEEIANMAVILTSDIGRMVVGDILYMTGGAGVITYDDI